jgi:hypothetical protein
MKLASLAAVLSAASAVKVSKIDMSVPSNVEHSWIAKFQPYASSKECIEIESSVMKAFKEQSCSFQMIHMFSHRTTKSKAFQGFSFFTECSQDVVSRILNDPRIEYISQNQMAAKSQVISPPGNDNIQQSPWWGLDRIDGVDDNQYDNGGLDGDGVSVYVIDTGVLVEHEEFEGRAQHGFDFVNNEVDATDRNGHGTHCATTVAGKVFGVAKAADVYGVQVLAADGFGSYDDIIAGINWSAEHGIASGRPSVLSLSLGGGFSQAVNDAIDMAVDSGVMVSVAAGNENSDACSRSPASAEKAITVAASDEGGNKASFSNFGPCVDTIAPGVAIKAGWWDATDSYNTISGTSMACPHVSGILAMMAQLDPTVPANQMSDALKCRAEVGAINGFSSDTLNLFSRTPHATEGVNPNCDTAPCPNDCSDHGECSWGSCTCVEGYFGDDCSQINLPIDLGTLVGCDSEVGCVAREVRDTRGAGSVYPVHPASDITYVFRSEVHTLLEITTCSGDTNYDTYLAVLSNAPSSPDGFQVLAQNDDSVCEFSGLQSTISLNVEANVPYFVVVDGYGSSEGQHSISISSQSSQPRTPAPTSAPAGTPPIDIGILNCDPFCEFSHISSNLNEPTMYEPPSGDRYYHLAVEQKSTIKISTCSASTDFDTYLTLVSLRDGQLLASNDDDSTCSSSSLHSTIVQEIWPEYPVLIVVHGFSDREGTYELSVIGEANSEDPCDCPAEAPCKHQNDGTCSQRSNMCGDFVNEGGQCAAGTFDCHATAAPPRNMCYAVSTVATDEWCNLNCNSPEPYCPADFCSCNMDQENFECPENSFIINFPAESIDDCACEDGFVLQQGCGIASCILSVEDAPFSCPENSYISSNEWPITSIEDCSCYFGFVKIFHNTENRTLCVAVEEMLTADDYTCPENSFISSVVTPLQSFMEDCTCDWGYIINEAENGCIPLETLEVGLEYIDIAVNFAGSVSCRTIQSQTRAIEDTIMDTTSAKRVAVISSECGLESRKRHLSLSGNIHAIYRGFCDGPCDAEGAAVTAGLVAQGVRLTGQVEMELGKIADEKETKYDPEADNTSLVVGIVGSVVGSIGFFLLIAAFVKKNRAAARAEMLADGYQQRDSETFENPCV